MTNVIDAKAKIAWNADDKQKRKDAIEEAYRTGKPVQYTVGDFIYVVKAEASND